MERVQRFCDFEVKRGKNVTAHGEPVPDDEPTIFEIDGKAYQVDICEGHREKLHEALDPFVAIAKPYSKPRVVVGGRKVMRGGRRGTFTSKDVREWLAQQGREVSPTGRIAQELIDEYKAAHR